MISLLHPMVQILCCVCLCAGSYLLTNMIDEEIQSMTTSNWGQFVDNTWLMSTRRCALHARGPWNFVFCFYHTASQTRGHGTVCHARPCSSRLCGRLSINIFTTLLSIAPQCWYSQTLTVSIHKSLHLNLTLLFHRFDNDGDFITVIGGNKTFGPYTEARDPVSFFMKNFTAKLSFKLTSGILVNRQAFEFIYQPSRIQGLNTYQLHPFEYLVGYGPWWIATVRVVINRIYQIKLHLTNLSCNLLQEFIVFDGPSPMPGILNDNKFNSSKNTNDSCGNYTILATTFQVYIAWMSIQSPDILGTIDYETHNLHMELILMEITRPRYTLWEMRRRWLMWLPGNMSSTSNVQSTTILNLILIRSTWKAWVTVNAIMVAWQFIMLITMTWHWWYCGVRVLAT